MRGMGGSGIRSIPLRQPAGSQDWPAPRGRSSGRLSYGEWRRRDPLPGLNEEDEARGAVRVEAVDSMPLVAGRTWVRLVAAQLRGNRPVKAQIGVFRPRLDGLNSGWPLPACCFSSYELNTYRRTLIYIYMHREAYILKRNSKKYWVFIAYL
jgi:hypothetical protein